MDTTEAFLEGIDVGENLSRMDRTPRCPFAPGTQDAHDWVAGVCRGVFNLQNLPMFRKPTGAVFVTLV